MKPVLILASLFALALALRPAEIGHPPAGVQMESPATTAYAPIGGMIQTVLVTRGDRVAAGQPLLRLVNTEVDTRLAQARAALEKLPPDAIEDVGALIERIPASTWNSLIRTDPRSLAAEQEYVDALAASERSPSAAAKRRLAAASTARSAALDRAGRFNPHLFGVVQDTFAEARELVHWLEQQKNSFDVVAPVGGVIELMDLKPGDTLSPLSPVALIAQ